MKKATLMLAAMAFMALASCKDEAAKGNDPMDNTSMETGDSNSGTHAEPGTPQAQDSTGMYSPDSTQASPPTVTQPQ
ncbi:MAG: hypothetical protein ACLGH8_14440 [Bacteroidia bacterium]